LRVVKKIYLLQAEHFNKDGNARRIDSTDSYKENVNLDLEHTEK
jgi:hypothetical protein